MVAMVAAEFEGDTHTIPSSFGTDADASCIAVTSNTLNATGFRKLIYTGTWM